MNFKKFLLFLLLLAAGSKSYAQDPCNCPEVYSPVCAALEVDGITTYLEMPNECLATCLGFTVVADSLCMGNPWGDCDCEIDDSEPFVCAQDSMGYSFQVPNACFATCWGLTVVADSLCMGNPWGDCDCEIDESEPEICVQFDGYTFSVPNSCIADCMNFTIVADSLCNRNPIFECECPFDNSLPWICAQDSLGHTCLVPNACFATCYGMTVVTDDLCEDSNVIDFGTIECFDDLIIEADMLFQEILLALNQSCNIELPECITNAPLFSSDSLFMDYVLNNCDVFGPTEDDNGPNFGNLYNFYRSISSKTNDSQRNINSTIQLIANPVSNNLVYLIESKVTTNAQISLMNINGQTLFSNKILLSEGLQKYDNDISQLKSGLYMLNLRTSEGQQSLKVVIIN